MSFRITNSYDSYMNTHLPINSPTPDKEAVERSEDVDGSQSFDTSCPVRTDHTDFSHQSQIDNQTDSTTQGRTTVTFNAMKRARQLAAAKNPEQVQSVIDLLKEDLSDCQAGVKSGACDIEEVNKVKRMLQRAKERMAQLSQRDDQNENDNYTLGLDAFDISSLM